MQFSPRWRNCRWYYPGNTLVIALGKTALYCVSVREVDVFSPVLRGYQLLAINRGLFLHLFVTSLSNAVGQQTKITPNGYDHRKITLLDLVQAYYRSLHERDRNRGHDRVPGE